MAKKSGQNPDTYFDLALVAIICSVIGARIYYVVFRWDLYKDDLLSIFNIRQGGLAIYGGVIAAIIDVYKRQRLHRFRVSRDRRHSVPVIPRANPVLWNNMQRHPPMEALRCILPG